MVYLEEVLAEEVCSKFVVVMMEGIGGGASAPLLLTRREIVWILEKSVTTPQI